MQKLSHFVTLSSEDKQLLRDSVVRVKEYSENHEIISEGERPEYAHLVMEGWACRFKHQEQGRRAIMAYLIPGDLCDIHITLLDHMDHSIGALTPVKAALISREAIHSIFKENGALARAFFWSVLIEESITREWFVNVTCRSADKRLAHIFCEMLIRYRMAGITQDNSIDLPLTQEELADAMGITSVHTNRVLQKLRKEGLVSLENKRLIIHDWENLKRFGEFDEAYLHLDEKKNT